jgi:hypothetical protein
MTRDCAVYALSVVWLIICLDDELVYWYEAAGLVTFYICYIVCEYNVWNYLYTLMVGAQSVSDRRRFK